MSKTTTLVGALHFRDLGGICAPDGRCLRSGALYRSDRLSTLTQADWQVVAQRGLAVLCDLRSNAERARHPTSMPASLGARILEFDIHNDLKADEVLVGRLRNECAAGAERVMQDIYSGFPAVFIPVLRAIVPRLTAGETPFLVHCSAGKDRTGFVIAVLLRMLGVAPAQIETDYLASSHWRTSPAHRAAMARRLTSAVAAAQMEEVLDAVLDARPAYLQAAFDAIDRQYGSFDHYLQMALGDAHAARLLLSQALLENPHHSEL